MNRHERYRILVTTSQLFSPAEKLREYAKSEYEEKLEEIEKKIEQWSKT